jgi:sortase (surface protein transpeptidase)
MKRFSIIFLISVILLSFSEVSFGKNETEKTKIETNNRRKKKNGAYRKKNHFFKKLIQGKNYCDCPKH